MKVGELLLQNRVTPSVIVLNHTLTSTAPLCSFSRYLVISSAVPYGASQTKYGWIFALALYFVDGDMEGNFTVNEQYHPLKS